MQLVKYNKPGWFILHGFAQDIQEEAQEWAPSTKTMDRLVKSAWDVLCSSSQDLVEDMKLMSIVQTQVPDQNSKSKLVELMEQLDKLMVQLA